MCTFKLIGISNWELYRQFHRAGSLEEYAEYLARLAALRKSQAEGPDVLIIREKSLPKEKYVRFFTDLWKKCEEYGENRAVLVPHTYFSAAQNTGSSRIHFPLPVLRRYQNTEDLTGIKEIGVSVHSVEEAKEAEDLGASYLTAGHIFTTDCKWGVPPRGMSFLDQVCGSVQIPVYAIGGIHMGNLPQIRESRAAGACMMSEYMKQ